MYGLQTKIKHATSATFFLKRLIDEILKRCKLIIDKDETINLANSKNLFISTFEKI